MNALVEKAKVFATSESGPTAVEYAVMLSLIIAACIATIGLIGTHTNALFQDVDGHLQ